MASTARVQATEPLSPTASPRSGVRSPTKLHNSPTLKVLCDKRFVSHHVSRVEKENSHNSSPLKKRRTPDSKQDDSPAKRRRVGLCELDSPKQSSPAPPYPDTPPPPLRVNLTPLSSRRKKRADMEQQKAAASPEGRRVRRKREAVMSPLGKKEKKQERRRQQVREAYIELLNSTRNYQDMLDRHEKFMEDLHNNGVKDATIALLFPNSPELSRLNTELLKELLPVIGPIVENKQAEEKSMPAAVVSQLFIKFAGEAAIPYAEWMKHVNSRKVKDIQVQLANDLPQLFEDCSLDSILITPVQRICKFQLLLHAIHKHTDVPEQASLIALARDFMEELCNKLDAGLVAQKRLEANALLRESTSFKEFDNASDFAQRNFARSVAEQNDFCAEITYTVCGNPVNGMVVTAGTAKPYQVHVFDQYLLITVMKQKSWVAKHLLDLSTVHIETFDSQDSKGRSSFGLLLLTPGMNGEDIGLRYHFQLPTRQERDCMQQALNTYIDDFASIHPERAQERSQYSISWTKDGPHVARNVVFTTNQCTKEGFTLNATTNEAVEALMQSDDFRQWQQKNETRNILTPQKRLRNWGATISGSAKKLMSKEFISRGQRRQRAQSISYDTDSDDE